MIFGALFARTDVVRSEYTAPDGTTTPSRQTRPSPIAARTRWESCTRSPEEPTDPCIGAAGTMFRLSIATSVPTVSTRMPL